MEKRQLKTPLLSAIKEYIDNRVIPFDVPGHKMGKVENDLLDFIGANAFRMDLNACIGLDNLYHPHGVIKESMELCAEAFGAEECLYSVNGTTGGLIASIMAVVGPNEKIILPRNVHKSIISALILTGAIPVFIKPDYDESLGIANGIRFEDVKNTIDHNQDAKAILVINPTYFGITSDLEEITEYAHKKDLLVIADEAHGSLFYFSDKLCKPAMKCGVDITSLSLHKTGGAMTQASLILMQGKRIDRLLVKKNLAIISSTSPNHILLCSLEAARKKLYFEGLALVEHTLELAEYGRKQLNAIQGISTLDSSYCKGDSRFGFDGTRLVINVSKLKVKGFEIWNLIRDKFNIQLELAETALILAVVGIGSTKEDVDKLVEAFKFFSEKYYDPNRETKVVKLNYDFPPSLVSPATAYHADNKVVPTHLAGGEISRESIMIYPPGIPLVIPGEIITKEALNLIEHYKKEGGFILKDSPEGFIFTMLKK